VSASELFRLRLPTEAPQDPPAAATAADPEAAPGGEVVTFPGTSAGPQADEPDRDALAERLRAAVGQFTAGWRDVWVGDGVLGMRPRSVADLARQYWTRPKPYIRDALILRIPYAIYGAPVIVLTAALHLFLLVISYPTLLAATTLLVVLISLFA
jgi:hypothetical protein